MKKPQELSRTTPGKPQAFSWKRAWGRFLQWLAPRGFIVEEVTTAPRTVEGFLRAASGETSDHAGFFQIRLQVTDTPNGSTGSIVVLHLNVEELSDLGDKFTMAAVGLAHGIDGPRDEKKIFPIPLERDDNVEREVP